jgi:hypothetical protein
MSYVRKKRAGPEVGVGGFTESETMYGGKRRRKRASRRKRNGAKNYGGLKVSPHKFGAGPGIAKGKNRPKY